MLQRIIMPVGIIEETNAAGATFRLTPQGEEAGLELDAHVTVWRYHPKQLAMARFTGRVTRVDEKEANFTILRAEVDERWPPELSPLEPGTPVYLAQRGSFEPDLNRTLVTVTRDEQENDTTE